MTDTKIIELYWNRQESAITESNLKYGTYCRAIAYNILQQQEDSDECVSDTWLRAWKEIPPTRPQKLKYYFARITRNLALDSYRAKHAQKRGGANADLPFDELCDCVSDEKSIDDSITAQELGQAINRFLKTLSQREAALFVRRYFYAETVLSIAKRHHLSENNTAVILSRTRQKLRAFLLKEGYEL